MADEVQRLLERMLPELDDYEEKGIFTRQEVKQIVKRRSDFEYKLQRRAVRLSDYERYIAYENALQALVKKRKARLHITSIGPHVHAPKAHINLIYERALMKFPGNVDLWTAALEQSKQNESYKFSSRLLARSLELHPRKDRFWVQAGAFEFEQNNDILAARSLMQRGLRLNKDSVALWCEYFRLELLYLNKLRERRKVLGIEKEDNIEATPPPAKRLKANETALNTEPEEESIPKAVNEEGPEHVQKELQREILYQGKLPQIVYSNAVKARPEDGEFRVKLAEVASDFFNSSVAKVAKSLVSQVWADIEANKHLSKSENLWNLRARFEFKHGEAIPPNLDERLTVEENRALDVLKKAEEFCTNKALLHQYVLEFLQARRLDRKVGGDSAEELAKVMFQTVQSDDELTETSAEILCDSNCSPTVLRFCLDRNPHYSSVLKRALQEANELSDTTRELFHQYVEKQRAMDSMDVVEIANVWLLYLDLCVRDEELSARQTIDEFKRAVRWFHSVKDGETGMCQVMRLLFNWLALGNKPGVALLQILSEFHNESIPPIIPARAYQAFIEVARDLVGTEDMRRVIDKATLAHPKCRSLWLQCLQYERTKGNVKKESILLSRATRTGCLRPGELTRDLLN